MSGAAADDPVARAALAAFAAAYPQRPDAGPLRAGAPVRVARLDRGGCYLLLVLADAQGPRGVVQLDADNLAVESAAQVRDPTAGALLSPERALEVARSAFPLFTDWQVPLLGWRPCRESFDSFRPLWVVAHTAGQVYVDQSGRAFARLTIGRGGA
jgi:hypothetical protein